MKLNEKRYRTLVRLYHELESDLEFHACEIARRLNNSGYPVEYNENLVTFEYNNACHCHPETRTGEFPSSWLFDPEWEKRVDEILLKKLHQKEELERRNAEIKEREERRDFERLRMKYDPIYQGKTK